ncbi:MAG: pyridoxamine 5'-phosphate oxidase [Halopseudomonas sp.]
MKFETLRNDYQLQQLHRDQMQASPFDQFSHWFEQARNAQLREPNAMVLATVDDQCRPSQRNVLLKHVDRDGFIFFTNRASRKAIQIDANSAVSLLFCWLGLERQVSISGSAEPFSRMEVVKYFTKRPRRSQLAAWASQQSRPIPSRSTLEANFNLIKQQFKGLSVPTPKHWGGYRVKPDQFEFWQGGSARLHDRFIYRIAGDDWQLSRLAP